MKPYSITRRLITTVLLIELISALCVTAVALVYERHTHFRSFDILLRGRADSMLGAVQDAEDVNDNVMLDGTESKVPSEDIYEVRDASGRVLGRSANWSGPAGQSKPDNANRDLFKLGSSKNDDAIFFTQALHGKIYRVIRIEGLRIVDPGDKGGGIRRYVTIYYGSSTKRVWTAVLRAVGFYALSSLLVLAATGVLMSWLLNRGLAPLRDLASGAAQVSVTSWDFSPPESARMTKELTPLIAALESVLLGLKRSFEQQKRFVSDAAHELKTSVAVVKSSLQLLQMKQRTTEEYEAGLERCLSDCARMEQMVAQMLMLARVEEDKVSESLNLRADVRLCVEEVTGRLGAMAESNRTSIVTRCHESFIARVDSELFKLLCINLLTNALQHSPPDSIITVDIRRLGDLAEMRVSDNGDGIAPEDLPHVFERFFRSDPSRSRRTGGTGLGLAICTAIADKFNGSIEITSKLNEGTTVLVRFPLANSAEADSTAPHR